MKTLLEAGDIVYCIYYSTSAVNRYDVTATTATTATIKNDVRFPQNINRQLLREKDNTLYCYGKGIDKNKVYLLETPQLKARFERQQLEETIYSFFQKYDKFTGVIPLEDLETIVKIIKTKTCKH